ncbi:hypothetical protein EAS56_17605 [Bradyrhizobium guangzhouense]|uniref:HEPN AbiU2-like domain-containing protein n=2 Tax=Bradyrhizobium guangzhouense TaxID=1325095 RepID=A0ABY0E7N5_9BRAD|nr:hypothetical protein EAS56_17605 [Bradyrhizobium guangzhouense]
MPANSIRAKISEAKVEIHKLSKCVLEGRKPPAGAYAFFNHNAHVLSALEDCGRIYERLVAGRTLLTKLSYEEERLRPDDWPAGTPYPEALQQTMKQSGDANEHMKLDLESLYVFGGVLLDQWAMQAIAVGNLPCKKQYPFRELVDYLDQNSDPTLNELWTAVKDDMLWLYYQLRFYRNRFIIHADRPWQRGTTRSVYGDDFNLFTPTPPGWLDDTALDAEIRGLAHLAPAYVPRRDQEHAGRLLEILFENIAQYLKSDREKISKLFGKKGGSTPNFHTLAQRLFGFVSTGTRLLVEAASANLASVDLGAPHQTSEEMRQARNIR